MSETDLLATTPEPPYYAVIFSSVRGDTDGEEYAKTAARMVDLARLQPGFLGLETAREDVGITVSYWRDLEAIRSWKRHADHVLAQRMGRSGWYERFITRIAKVERDYAFDFAKLGAVQLEP